MSEEDAPKIPLLGFRLKVWSAIKESPTWITLEDMATATSLDVNSVQTAMTLIRLDPRVVQRTTIHNGQRVIEYAFIPLIDKMFGSVVKTGGRIDLLKCMDNSIYEQLHKINWFDLYQFLGTDYRSMDSWLQQFGLQKNRSGFTGRQMPQYFKEKKHNEIENYILEELPMCEKLFYLLIEKYPSIFERRK